MLVTKANEWQLKENVLQGSPDAQIGTGNMTGSEAKDLAALRAFGTINAVLDLTLPQASKSPYLRSATSSLRCNDRVRLMGFVEQPVVPWTFMGQIITIRGKLTYEREGMFLTGNMLEQGLFPGGKALVHRKAFKLEDWRCRLDAAAEHT